MNQLLKSLIVSSVRTYSLLVLISVAMVIITSCSKPDSEPSTSSVIATPTTFDLPGARREYTDYDDYLLDMKILREEQENELIRDALEADEEYEEYLHAQYADIAATTEAQYLEYLEHQERQEQEYDNHAATAEAWWRSEQGSRRNDVPCDSGYEGVCIPLNVYDLDCEDITEQNFRVVGGDIHQLDRDEDGWACEPYEP